MTALSDIEKLAVKVAKEAFDKDTSLDVKIEALKVLGPYYTLLKKAEGKADTDSPTEPSMGDLQRQLRHTEDAAHGGSEAIPGRQRRN